MTVAFVHRIRTAAHPLIPAQYFHRRNFVMPMVLRATANFAYFGAFFLFPLLMEQGYGYSIPRVGRARHRASHHVLALFARSRATWPCASVSA